MAQFFLRPELHNHDSGDYEQLHNELAAAGYYRVVRLDNNIWHDLPTGEYHKYSTNLIDTEKTVIEAAILQVVNNNRLRTKDYWYVLTNSDASEVKLKLKRTTDQAKLPPGEWL
jgi:hypothetical protein